MNKQDETNLLQNPTHTFYCDYKKHSPIISNFVFFPCGRNNYKPEAHGKCIYSFLHCPAENKLALIFMLSSEKMVAATSTKNRPPIID